MNTVSIIGRLGQNPETRTTTSGKQITSFSVAVENRHQDDPDWVAVEVWGKLAQVVADHKHQGDQVGIVGRLTSSSWEDSDGNKRHRLYVTADTVDFLHTVNADNGKEVA